MLVCVSFLGVDMRHKGQGLCPILGSYYTLARVLVDPFIYKSNQKSVSKSVVLFDISNMCEQPRAFAIVTLEYSECIPLIRL